MRMSDCYSVSEVVGSIPKPIEPVRLMSVIDEVLSGRSNREEGIIHG